MKLLTMTNLEEVQSGALVQAHLLSSKLNSSIMHFIPGGGDSVMTGNLGSITTHYPVQSLNQSIEVVDPDVLLVHSISNNFINEIKHIKKICKIVCVSHFNFHEMILDIRMREYLNYIQFVLNASDLVISVSKEQKKIMSGFVDSNIEVITPAIDYDKLSNIKHKPRENEFIMCDRLSPIKNHISVLFAMKKLVKKYPNSFLKIFGFGELNKFYKDMIGQLKLSDNVNIFGAINHDKLLEEMSTSTALVSGSFSENNSVSVLEANAIGLPVITSTSPVSLASKMYTCSRNYSVYKKNAVNKKSLMKNYDINIIAKRYRECLKKLL